ncbi:MAG: LysR family transcriptional regulator [Deltaproteobacteria bacterium]
MRRMLEQYGSQREAARRLGVHQSTISRKLQRLQKR